MFEHAAASGVDCSPLTIDHAKVMLGKVRHETKHMKALPWQDVPAFYAQLGDTAVDECIKLIILTVVRSDAGRGARLSEVEGDVWTIPERRIKGLVGTVSDFRVPLSDEAIKIFERAALISNDLVFQSYTGRRVSENGPGVRMKAMECPATLHGFRSSFKSWSQEPTFATSFFAAAQLPQSGHWNRCAEY